MALTKKEKEKDKKKESETRKNEGHEVGEGGNIIRAGRTHVIRFLRDIRRNSTRPGGAPRRLLSAARTR